MFPLQSYCAPVSALVVPISALVCSSFLCLCSSYFCVHASPPVVFPYQLWFGWLLSYSFLPSQNHNNCKFRYFRLLCGAVADVACFCRPEQPRRCKGRNRFTAPLTPPLCHDRHRKATSAEKHIRSPCLHRHPNFSPWSDSAPLSIWTPLGKMGQLYRDWEKLPPETTAAPCHSRVGP